MSTILSDELQIIVPGSVCEQMGWQAGQEFVFIRKKAGVLLMPVPELEALRGIAKGACTQGVRDRQDRV